MHCWSVEFLCQTHQFFYSSVYFIEFEKSHSLPGAISQVTSYVFKQFCIHQVQLSPAEENMSTFLDAAEIRLGSK